MGSHRLVVILLFRVRRRSRSRWSLGWWFVIVLTMRNVHRWCVLLLPIFRRWLLLRRLLKKMRLRWLVTLWGRCG